MSIFDEMMKQYESSHNGKRDNGSQKTYDLKNYFNTILPKGVDSQTKRVRILPPSGESKTPFTTMWGHTKKINGEWKTFPCLKHEMDEDCPFCQAREAVLATGKDEDKELSKQYSARQYYIIKVIDRDNEADGVKFWRIKHNYKKQGAYDKIMAAIKNAGHDITDTENGRDLNIEIIRDGLMSTIQAISVALDKTPLSTNEEKVNTWTSDVRTWEDVYSVRGYEYLAIVVKGDSPVWDKDEKRYVGKLEMEAKGKANSDEDDDLEDELEIGIKESESKASKVKESKTEKSEPVSVTSNDEEDEDDDLPF
jgi:hypothetical protein